MLFAAFHHGGMAGMVVLKGACGAFDDNDGDGIGGVLVELFICSGKG